MERNTLLAIILAAVVLFSYQVIFVAPKQTEMLNNSQNIAAQSVSTLNSLPETALPNNEKQTTNFINKTIDYELKTPDKDISYTNMGGSLHKIDFFGNNPFPITDVLNIAGLENVIYTGQKLDNKTVSLIYTGKDLQIRKLFYIVDKDFIKVRMEINNLSKISILNNFSFTAFEINISSLDINHLKIFHVKGHNTREDALYEYSILSNNRIFRKGNAIKFNDRNYKQGISGVTWVGFRDHYNSFIVKPEFEAKGFEIKADSDEELNVSINPQTRNLAPGESAIYNFNIYAGPQNPWLMKKYNQGFEKIVAFSNFLPIEWVGQGIYHIIPILHGIFRSWGIAIILISLMIYGITYPLSLQTMMSMRKMQEVQPKIKALQERYKNDPQKLNAEMVEIYRREKINPLGGCLPMFIQMPFFMALYQILWRAQYLEGQGFLWIKDLSQPDHLMALPFSLPFSLGNELNILPILTGGIMFLQQKMSSKNMVVTDEQQAMQQKMMMFFLPIMMTFVFYNFASSWALYFLVYYILTTATQWKIAQTVNKKVS